MVQYSDDFIELPGDFAVVRDKVIGIGPLQPIVNRSDAFEVMLYTSGGPIPVRFVLTFNDDERKTQSINDANKLRIDRAALMRKQMIEKLFGFEVQQEPQPA